MRAKNGWMLPTSKFFLMDFARGIDLVVGDDPVGIIKTIQVS